MSKIIVVCGPTASGKSNLALDMAQNLNAEIVSADSMQLYRHMDIGTAKVSASEQEQVKHHLLDTLEPDATFSVADYVIKAEEAITEIEKRGKRVIVCGGTGQYINALLDGLNFASAPPKDKTISLRKQIENTITSENMGQWHAKISILDPQSAHKIATSDLRRIRRFFEVYETTGLTKTEINLNSKKNGPKHEFISFCLLPPRPELYERINLRVEKMIEAGLLNEIKYLLDNYPHITEAQSFQAIGYKEFLPYFQSQSANPQELLAKLVVQCQQASRRYAKRQSTWFRARNDLQFIPSSYEPNTVASRELLTYLLELCRN